MVCWLLFCMDRHRQMDGQTVADTNKGVVEVQAIIRLRTNIYIRICIYNININFYFIYIYIYVDFFSAGHLKAANFISKNELILRPRTKKKFFLNGKKTSPLLLLPLLDFTGFGNHLNILVDVVFYFTGFGHSQFFRGLFFLLLYNNFTGFGIL